MSFLSFESQPGAPKRNFLEFIQDTLASRVKEIDDAVEHTLNNLSCADLPGIQQNHAPADSVVDPVINALDPIKISGEVDGGVLHLSPNDLRDRIAGLHAANPPPVPKEETGNA